MSNLLKRPQLKRANTSIYVPMKSNNIYNELYNFDIKTITSLYVSLREDTSYDDNTHISSNGRYNILITFRDVSQLFQLLTNNETKTENKILNNILTVINKIGYSQTTFNFECCSGCTQNCHDNSNNKLYQTNYFGDEKTSQCVISFVDYVLEQGSYTMFADFSFKALIQNWDTIKLGVCPFRNITTTVGLLEIVCPLESTKNSQFGQLSHIASLAIPEQKTDENEVSNFLLSINSLPATLVYDISSEIDPNIKLYVQSVIPDTSNIDVEFNSSIAYGSNNISGLPVHTVVNFANKKGVMIVSNVHFKELHDINVNIDSVMNSAEQIFGRTRSDEMKQQLSLIKCPKLTRAVTSGFVAEITNGSNPIVSRPSKKAKTLS